MNKENSLQSMMVFKADWKGQATFRMLPVVKDCPFTEVLYDPEQNVLAIISTNHIPKYQMLPKLNGRGELTTYKTKNEKGDNVVGQAQERSIVESYYEYYIEDKKDIAYFLDVFAINPEHPVLAMAKTPVVGKPASKKPEMSIKPKTAKTSKKKVEKK